MNPMIQPKQRLICPRARITKRKILRNTFISVGVFFAFARLLVASTTDGVLNISKSALGVTQPLIVTFDAPGAGTGPNQGTRAFAVTPAVTIAGDYIDASNLFHGFLRTEDGTITPFNAPGAGTGPYQGTASSAINSFGAITGTYADSGSVFHGYVRTPDPGSTITTFDVPGGGTGPAQGTQPWNINSRGLITGSYVDSGNVNHGFVRTPDPGSTITTFDVTGAGTGPGQGTFVTDVDGLNDAGATVGYYIDSNDVAHGFVRTPDPSGTITTFNVTGAGTGPGQGTGAFGINSAGTIVGGWIDANNVEHGFVRTPDPGSTITTFDVPGGGTGPGQGSFPVSINASGAMTGNYVDASDVSHGFLRAPDGTITATFDAPGGGTGSGQGTFASCNNPRNAITGYYLDSNNTSHGFLREEPLPTPRPRPTPVPRP